MTRPQSEPIGIGVPTGTALGRRQRHCPGATLRVTREDYASMRRAGEVFATGSDDIRQDGVSDARVFCTRDVADIRVPQYKHHEGKMTFAVYDAALGASCADAERTNPEGPAHRERARQR